MPIQNASQVKIEDLGAVPDDLVTLCHQNNLFCAEDLYGQSTEDLMAIGMSDADIIALNEMLRKHDFATIESSAGQFPPKREG